MPVTGDPANRYALVADRTGRYAALSTPVGVQLLDIEQRREVLTVARAGGAAIVHLVPLAFAPDTANTLWAVRL